MNKNFTRPQGMSQLDYLWTHFGGYEIKDSSDSILLTEEAIQKLVSETTSKSITKLTYSNDTIKGYSNNDALVSTIKLPKEIHTTGFTSREVTQEDINNGCTFKKGSLVLSLTLSDDTEFLVNLEKYDIQLSTASTSTIDTVLKDNIISADLRINEGLNKVSVVEIKQNVNGVYANLKTENTQSVKLDQTNGTLKASVLLKGTNYELSFERVTLDTYLAIQDKNPSTMYFITDYPYIYLSGVKYGNFIDESSLISRIEFNSDEAKLIIHYHNIQDPSYIQLGFASETTNGLMSKDTYKLFMESLQGITGSVKDYVDNKVDSITLTEDYIEGNNTKTINFKNGDTTSSIQIDVLNWVNT